MNVADARDPGCTVAPAWTLRYQDARVSSLSRWEDDVWHLDVPSVTQYQRTINWARPLSRAGNLNDACHRSLLLAGKAVLFEMLSGGFGESRPVKQSSLAIYAHYLFRLLRWMSKRRLYSFSDLSMDHIAAYRRSLEKLRPKGDAGIGQPLVLRSTTTIQLNITPLRVLIASATRIPDQPRGDRHALLDLLAVRASDKKPTERIPDEIAGPLFETACTWVQSFGPTLLAQYEAMDYGYQASLSLDPDHRSTHAHAARRKLAAGSSLHIRTPARQIDVGTCDGLTFRSLIRHLETACYIIIAGMVGMRVSEIGSLTRGCLAPLELPDGRVMLQLFAMLYKTSTDPHGTKREWVAGWDDGKNPVRAAVELLERLRAIDAPHTDKLFVGLKFRNSRSQKSLYMQVHNARIRAFAAFVGIVGWTFTSHQFRKTFARFVTKRDYTGLLALKRHFAHVSIQMTEVYGSWDDELVKDILEADVEQDFEALDKILGAENLAGARGEEIAGRNHRFRGIAGVEARASYINDIRSDESTDRLLLIRLDYGYCATEIDWAACGLEAWRVGPPTCADCHNLIVTEDHRPYWEGIYGTLIRDLENSDRFAAAHVRDLQNALKKVAAILRALSAPP